jgi:glycosyltransferase involved in cell wall biosynthesis
MIKERNLQDAEIWCKLQQVSVVIPTIGNNLLSESVFSVLSQTRAVHEIIIVADTLERINHPASDKIKLIRTGPGAGGNVARQAGIDASTGNLIALLDDDDMWLPDKIETQLKAVYESTRGNADFWLSSTRIHIKFSEGSETTVPLKRYEAGTKLPHYLFKRTGIMSHHGYIQSSAMLFPRTLAMEVPFDVTLRFHQDISWVVDVCARYPDIPYVQCWKDLVIKNSVQASVSKTITPEKSIAWAQGRLSGEGRILGDFILTQSLFFAKRNESAAEMIRTISSGLRLGSPGLAAIVYSILTTLKALITRKARF